MTLKKKFTCPCSKNIKKPDIHKPPYDECECGTKHNQFAGRCIVCGGQVYEVIFEK